MDLRLIDYPVYIAVSIFLTVWVGNTLFRNGRPFLGSVADMLKQTVTRIGVVLLVLGFMHFNNLLILRTIRRRDRPMPPINYNPYQPVPGA